jgi:hypothetical protein
VTRVAGGVLALARRGAEKLLVVDAQPDAGAMRLADFEGEALPGAPRSLRCGPLSPKNAAALRSRVPFTAPVVAPAGPSFGLGDRLGLATPGHVRAVRAHPVWPVFAQQSVRELTRTGRTPEDVLDAATWGVFETGYRSGYSADADHLKTTADIDRFVRAGFTMFTADPSGHVVSAADVMSPAELALRFDGLPWSELEDSRADCRRRYAAGRVALGAGPTSAALTFSGEDLLRAAVKFGGAVAHVARLYRHLVSAAGSRPFDFEVSVDETDTAMSPFEHYFVAAELRRLGVRWTSLAPRFPGRFEKGVDYLGALDAFRVAAATHAAIAAALGSYKLSLHSGSDKFAVYPPLSAAAGPHVHVKTAGTSYLEALRVLAATHPPLFRAVLDVARAHYETDRASYSVSAELARVPAAGDVADAALPALLDDFHVRQVCHVTFGSVLLTSRLAGDSGLRQRTQSALREQDELYARYLETHLGRHLAYFG